MRTMNWALGLVAAAGIVLAGGCGTAEHAHHDGDSEKTHDTHQAGAAHMGASEAEGGIVSYPLDWCVVSGDKLGAMGKPVSITHQGQEIKFCCKNCVKGFKANPDQYLKKIADAKSGHSQPQSGKMKGHDAH